MTWEFIMALVFAVPIILAPVAYVWYLNIGGVYSVLKERKKARLAAKRVVAR